MGGGREAGKVSNGQPSPARRRETEPGGQGLTCQLLSRDLQRQHKTPSQGLGGEGRGHRLLLRAEWRSLIVLLREDIELATLIHRGAWLRVAVISVIKPLSYWIMGLGYRRSSLLIL